MEIAGSIRAKFRAFFDYVRYPKFSWFIHVYPYVLHFSWTNLNGWFKSTFDAWISIVGGIKIYPCLMIIFQPFQYISTVYANLYWWTSIPILCWFNSICLPPKSNFCWFTSHFFLVKSPFFMIKHIVSHIVSLDPPKFVPFLPLFHGFSRTSKESPGRCGWWSMPSGRGRRGDVRRGTPPVISWFINHSKYRYIYHKP